MNAILHTMRLAVGNRAIAILGGDAAAMRGRIACALGIDPQESPGLSAMGTSTTQPADVLVIAEPDESGADLDSASMVAADGWLVASGDDAVLRRKSIIDFAQQHRGRVLWFGRTADCDVPANDVAFADGCLRFRSGQQWFQAPAWSRSSLKEVLAAVAVARIFGVPSAQAAERLASSRPISSQRRVIDAQRVTIIHDTADATAASLTRSLDLLREFAAAGRRIVCCGELSGDEGDKIHRAAGNELVSRSGADELIACGENAQRLVDAAGAAGLPARSAAACREASEAVRRLVATLKDGDVLLVTGGPVEALTGLVERVRDSLGARNTSQTHVAADGLAVSLISLPQFTS